MSEMTFTDELPEASQGREQTRERAAEIKANAPRWAQWPSQTPPSAVKKALEKIDEDFEVVGRKCADGKTRAFVRFAPVDDAPPPAASNGNGNGNGHAASATRPKVKCPTCSQFINIEAGEIPTVALTRHERTNAVCKASNKRNRNVVR